jgi:hypothetical protein
MIRAAQTLADTHAIPSIEGTWSSAGTKSIQMSSPEKSPSSPHSEVDGETTHDHTPPTSTPPSECGLAELSSPCWYGSNSVSTVHHELYSENIIAKILRVAYEALPALPEAFPEIVPQDEGSLGNYELRSGEFWTCGFFPGTMYAILERLIRYPGSIHVPAWIDRRQLHSQLVMLCHEWDQAIRKMDSRTDTHEKAWVRSSTPQAAWRLDMCPQHERSGAGTS